MNNNRNNATRAAVKATAKKTPRAERTVLAIIRPHTGDLTRGYSFAIQTKKHLQLIGEIALARKFNGLKADQTAPVEKICVKSLDFAEVLATGLEFCRTNGFVPCRSIALLGEGAMKLVKAKKIVTDKWADLNAAVAEANAALIAVATTAGGDSKSRRERLNGAAAKASAAVKARDAFKDTYTTEMKKYRTAVNRAVGTVGGFADLRKPI